MELFGAVPCLGMSGQSWRGTFLGVDESEALDLCEHPNHGTTGWGSSPELGCSYVMAE